VGATVAVEWLVEDEQRDRTTEVDVTSITSKQREALETALELGYYDSPRGADLGDCAAALDISKSAVSQRLNTAETKLVRSFFGWPDRT
jgi:predicted DNA binding protein